MILNPCKEQGKFSVEHLGMILNRLKEQGKFSVEHLGMILNRLKEQGKFSVEHLGMILNRLKEQGKFNVEHLGMILNRLKEQGKFSVEHLGMILNRLKEQGKFSVEHLGMILNRLKEQGRNYRLVVICSSENEDRSRIVAALDKYRRPQLPTDHTNIKKISPDKAENNCRCSVRVIKSWRAGVGKSLYKKRMVTDLYKLITNITRRKASNVQEGVDAFLFQLLVLGCLGHSTGNVWRRSELDYYIIESMPLLARDMDVQVSC
ncbi:RNF213 [Mytilus edulis]|uniref:RNF213 n=1 Tax=Mytilus edulis TaxID=6550 RepID=A0A8S3Q7K7_MYTED|nr:RNF213 [Mytilus edulis]